MLCWCSPSSLVIADWPIRFKSEIFALAPSKAPPLSKQPTVLTLINTSASGINHTYKRYRFSQSITAQTTCAKALSWRGKLLSLPFVYTRLGQPRFDLELLCTYPPPLLQLSYNPFTHLRWHKDYLQELIHFYLLGIIGSHQDARAPIHGKYVAS